MRIVTWNVVSWSRRRGNTGWLVLGGCGDGRSVDTVRLTYLPIRSISTTKQNGIKTLAQYNPCVTLLDSVTSFRFLLGGRSGIETSEGVPVVVPGGGWAGLSSALVIGNSDQAGVAMQ